MTVEFCGTDTVSLIPFALTSHQDEVTSSAFTRPAKLRPQHHVMVFTKYKILHIIENISVTFPRLLCFTPHLQAGALPPLSGSDVSHKLTDYRMTSSTLWSHSEENGHVTTCDSHEQLQRPSCVGASLVSYFGDDI